MEAGEIQVTCFINQYRTRAPDIWLPGKLVVDDDRVRRWAKNTLVSWRGAQQINHNFLCVGRQNNKEMLMSLVFFVKSVCKMTCHIFVDFVFFVDQSIKCSKCLKSKKLSFFRSPTPRIKSEYSGCLFTVITFINYYLGI